MPGLGDVIVSGGRPRRDHRAAPATTSRAASSFGTARRRRSRRPTSCRAGLVIAGHTRFLSRRELPVLATAGITSSRPGSRNSGWRPEVLVPAGVLQRAALRRDQDPVVAVHAVDQGILPDPSGLAALHAQDRAAGAVPVVSRLAAGRFMHWRTCSSPKRLKSGMAQSLPTSAATEPRARTISTRDCLRGSPDDKSGRP